jgi:hypothetical protein
MVLGHGRPVSSRPQTTGVDGLTRYLAEPPPCTNFQAQLKHRHRYFGVLAPRARLRPIVTATAGPAPRAARPLAPQLEMPFAQTAGSLTWAEMNQTTDFPDDA